jgi:hypothetical protein
MIKSNSYQSSSYHPSDLGGSSKVGPVSSDRLEDDAGFFIFISYGIMEEDLFLIFVESVGIK